VFRKKGADVVRKFSPSQQYFASAQRIISWMFSLNATKCAHSSNKPIALLTLVGRVAPRAPRPQPRQTNFNKTAPPFVIRLPRQSLAKAGHSDFPHVPSPLCHAPQRCAIMTLLAQLTPCSGNSQNRILSFIYNTLITFLRIRALRHSYCIEEREKF
jgi:hypothetical protein